ncbi:MAG: hypothetical protein Q7J57_08935 [Gemmobacter sp.]|nr:hypothetical protein [Gemmobacter sp.]
MKHDQNAGGGLHVLISVLPLMVAAESLAWMVATWVPKDRRSLYAICRFHMPLAGWF